MKFLIFINNRDYTDWIFKDIKTDTVIDVNDYPILKTINPIKDKLFTRDVIEFDNNKLVIIKSAIKETQSLAGVLLLEDNKTFGRVNNKKLLFKCIPDDKYLPAFLVAYELKLGFSKRLLNKYVVFKYKHWDNKHPCAELIHTLGDVNNLEVFYEYQLYCKSLCISLKEFTNKANKANNSHDGFIEQILKTEKYNIEDRRNNRIITIDPPNSVDFDDGFGVQELYNEKNNHIGWIVSIYIANVFVWLETLELWNTFSHRVSTIYLPDRKRPMLPTILSDNLCSLHEKKDRFSLVLDLPIDLSGNLLLDKIKYKNVLINVNKNYNYEESNLLFNDQTYSKLYNIASIMDNEVSNSHHMVAHWMTIMNAVTGLDMVNKKAGIFRSVVLQDSNMNKNINLDNYNLNNDTKQVIKNWNNVSGHYIQYDDNIELNHELINLKSMEGCIKNIETSTMQPYIHITSPIRRLIDLLNQIILLDKYKLVDSISLKAYNFLNEWISKLDYINVSMRSIKRVQTDCSLYDNCTRNPSYLNTTHKGVLFDKIRRNNGTYHYTVYLEKLKIITRITTQLELPEYDSYNFQMYLFETEDKVKKKIKLQLL